jgi:Protein of unknown function (DUF2865)
MADGYSRRTNWRAGVLGCALSVTLTPESVPAQGIFDFLFGNSQPHDVAPIHPPPPAERPGRIAPPALGRENVNVGSGSTGHGVAFCVRLCDGHHFPLEKIVRSSAAESCRASCPFSKTKVFFGSEIGSAVAADGQHYANLDTAFSYRKQLTTNCTCNGKNAFGLAPSDVRNDPTLHTGDLISTKSGLVAYTGNSGQGPIFTPVNAAASPFNTPATTKKPSETTENPKRGGTPGAQ